MAEVKIKNPMLLIISLLNVLLLAIGHAYNSQALLWGAIIMFVTLVIFSPKSDFLAIMLFYLPWSPVLKTMPNTFTFASLVIPVVFFIVLFEKEQDYKTTLHIGFAILLTAYTLFVKLLNALALQTSYFFFIMMLFFIPLYVSKYKTAICFERCILFLTAGILSACISSEILMNYPHMLQYIDVNTVEQIGLIRLSGFVGDPNYYSAQILVAISALLIVLNKTERKALIVLQIVAIIVLLYFGLQSVSKMFIVSIAFVAVLWIFNMLIEKRSISYKFGMIVSILIVVGIVIATNLFTDQKNLYLLRVEDVTDADTLTTGRSNLWGIYLNYLVSNITDLFFGIGLSQNQVRIDIYDAHSTLIEIIYQLGIIGGLILLFWWKGVYQDLVDKTKLNFSRSLYFLIMGSSVFLPWLALGMIYSKEFFYFILLLFLSRKYLSEENNEKYGIVNNERSTVNKIDM